MYIRLYYNTSEAFVMKSKGKPVDLASPQNEGWIETFDSAIDSRGRAPGTHPESDLPTVSVDFAWTPASTARVQLP